LGCVVCGVCGVCVTVPVTVPCLCPRRTPPRENLWEPKPLTLSDERPAPTYSYLHFAYLLSSFATSPSFLLLPLPRVSACEFESSSLQCGARHRQDLHSRDNYWGRGQHRSGNESDGNSGAQFPGAGLLATPWRSLPKVCMSTGTPSSASRFAVALPAATGTSSSSFP